MIALGKILNSALSNDAGVAALVDDRIYPNVIPQEIERPCISYEVGSLPGIDGTAPIYSTTVVVSCFAREKSLAHGVATLADAVLSPLRGAADGVELRSMSRSSYQDGFDPDLDAYAVVVTYTAMLVLSADANTVWANVPAAQIDHGGLNGLGDDDHPQYLKVANYTSPPTRVFAGAFSDVIAPGAGDDLKFGRWNNGAQRLEWVSVSASPGGSTGQVQYNSGGTFAGHSGLTYNGAGVLTAGTAISVGSAGTAPLHVQSNTDSSSNQIASLYGNDRAAAANNDSAYISMYLDDATGSPRENVRLLWAEKSQTANQSQSVFKILTRSYNTLYELATFERNLSGTVYWRSVDGASSIQWGANSFVFNAGGYNLVDFTLATGVSLQNNTSFRTKSNTGKIYLGSTSQSSLVYDGTNLVVNPKESGSGIVVFLGEIQTNKIRLTVTPTSEIIVCTHTIVISANGIDYKIPCVAA